MTISRDAIISRNLKLMHYNINNYIKLITKLKCVKQKE